MWHRLYPHVWRQILQSALTQWNADYEHTMPALLSNSVANPIALVAARPVARATPHDASKMTVLPKRKHNVGNCGTTKNHVRKKHVIQRFVQALLANPHRLVAARGHSRATTNAIPRAKMSIIH
jgi:hypothetical protein